MIDPRATTLESLNQLLTVLQRSLPLYLSEASPFVPEGQERHRQTLANVAADQARLAERIGEMIYEKRGRINLGPAHDYTAYTDLDVDFLVNKCRQRQQREIAAIEQIVRRLDNDVEAQALAQEVLGAARAHLESLEELTAGRNVESTSGA